MANAAFTHAGLTTR